MIIPDSDLESKAVYDQQLSELKQAFGAFDRDGSGTIAKHELQACLHTMGVHPTPAEFDYLYQSMDTDGDGVVNFQEFLTVMTDEFEEAQLEHELEEMKQFFTMMDKDGSGKLSPKEVRGRGICMNGVHSDMYAWFCSLGMLYRRWECRYLMMSVGICAKK